MIKKLRIMFGWFFAGTFSLGSLMGISMFFTEPESYGKNMGIFIAVINLLTARAFYIIGPGWEVFSEKRKLKAMIESLLLKTYRNEDILSRFTWRWQSPQIIF